MKKVLWMMAFILPFLVASCSNDDDKDDNATYSAALVGTWKSSVGESLVYTLVLKTDRTGSKTTTVSGATVDVDVITKWDASKTKFYAVYADKESDSDTYVLKDSLLYLDEIVYTRQK